VRTRLTKNPSIDQGGPNLCSSVNVDVQPQSKASDADRTILEAVAVGESMLDHCQSCDREIGILSPLCDLLADLPDKG
jgi:hypothetical protein